MLQANQAVYFTTGPLVQEAVFIRYENKICVLRTAFGLLKLRPGRVFTQAEADEKGLLIKDMTRIREAFAT